MSLTLKDLRVDSGYDRHNTSKTTRPASLADLVEVLKQHAESIWWCEIHRYSGIEKSCLYGHTTGRAKKCRMAQRLVLPLDGTTPK